MTSEARPLPDYLVALTAAEYGSDSHALHLLQVFHAPNGHFTDTAHVLLSSAKGQSGESWNERCLAVLLLESHLLRVEPNRIEEFDVILTALGLKPQTGEEIRLNASVLEEGFSTRDLRGFSSELCRRLRRLNRVHESIRRADCERFAWEYFVRSSRDLSKLTLARYVFSVDDVIKNIEATLVVTRGTKDTISRFGNQLGSSSICDPSLAPRFEMEIVQRLCSDRRIYWVSDKCGSELNSMVEYPLTSAVVVVKPPGSDLEIEIKRAGVRGRRQLDVITERNGVPAPLSHRLFGGSLGWLAQREAASAGIFSKIFRLVHGKDAPCSRTVRNSSVVTVPSAEGPVHILDYLSDEEHFGDGFHEMRKAMNSCIQSFPSDTGVARASYQGEAGETLQFIGQALPQQAVIVGSSSFRLDRISAYLSDAGPNEYFRVGLGRGYTLRDMRWLADSVLEEILGEVVVPPGAFVDYSQYVRDAFRIAENRKLANENYLSVMRQIGECWGTLLAVRGFSDGESFVLRNVGLKSIWKNGDWEIRIIFQDHDDLTVAGSRYRYLWPWRELAGMERDLVHILGGPMGDETIPGEVGALRNIYRVGLEVGDAGLKRLEEATVLAYDRTQSQLGSNHELQNLFYARFLQGYRDFDFLVPGFLKTDPSQIESWKREAAAYLSTKGYEDELINEYTNAICRWRAFLERMSFLYAR